MNKVHFHFSTIETSFNTPAPSLALSEEEQALIAANWQSVNSLGNFFNGLVLAGTAIDFENEPKVTVSTSDYAHYLYANAHSEATPCRIVYCAAAIITSDNRVLIGEMNSSTASPGRLQFVAGNVEVASDGSISANRCCQREITEEIGSAFLENADLLQPLCIKTGGKADHIGIYYRLRLDLTANEAEALFNEYLTQLRIAGEKPELIKAHFVELTKEAVSEFFHHNGDRSVDYLQPLLLEHTETLRRH